MNISTVLIILTFLLCDFTSLAGQDRIPREYTNPEEMISFDRRTNFTEAIDVLNTFAQEFENRFIINRTDYTGPIGVTLPAMHWKDALDYILRVQNFVLLESPDVYELVTQEEADRIMQPESGATATAAGAGQALTPEQELRMKINTDSKEVRINATFFEGNKRALREIGVDWSTLTNAVPDNIGQFVNQDAGGAGGGGGAGGAGGQETGQLPTTNFGDSFVNVNSRGAQSVSQNVFNALVNFGDVNGVEVQALFSAFEADNLGKILATPSIKVLNGEEGRIQVGQDFSIKQRDFAGNVTDQFFSTGTILTVTPQIVEINDTTLIYLDLQAERSTAQPDPVSTTINKQQANTHAILLDGESTVIAGLYTTEESEVRRGIPFLKDLPGWFFGLKYLFGYNSTDVSENELIVLLQAELEESIPERVSARFKSQRELFDEKQERHRSGFDYVSPRSPFFEEEEVSVETEENEDNEDIEGDPELETEEVNEVVEIIETPQPKTDIDLDELRAEIEKRKLEAADVQKRDISSYSGEWREMEMENLNGDYSNLDFYVIGGSFLVRDNADRLYNNFKEEGLDAHMLYNEATGYYFVAYKGFETAEEAIPYLEDIQSLRQPEAWLSKVIRETRLDLNGN
ncbi:MAG: hypothetical protein WD735_01690 [Balneolaceae bacterium]